MFPKVKHIRTFEIVADLIQEAVFSGELKPGQKLPPERELIGKFEVSRRALREAYRVLEQKGLIEIKTGSKGGAFIREINDEHMTESLALLIRLNKASIYNLMDFRSTLEAAAASMAATKATPEDVSQLKALLKECEAMLDKDDFDWKPFLELDGKIHTAIATISGNPFYELVLNSIHKNIEQYYETYLPKDKSLCTQIYNDLIPIVVAIEDGDPELAAKKAQVHVEHGLKIMQKKE